MKAINIKGDSNRDFIIGLQIVVLSLNRPHASRSIGYPGPYDIFDARRFAFLKLRIISGIGEPKNALIEPNTLPNPATPPYQSLKAVA
jgi:hypothetical protein